LSEWSLIDADIFYPRHKPGFSDLNLSTGLPRCEVIMLMPLQSSKTLLLFVRLLYCGILNNPSRCSQCNYCISIMVN